jgi:hypothetical protein
MRPGLRDLALGLRLALAGGPSSRLRAGMTAIGVGLGVALLLGAASLPSMVERFQERGSARGVPIEGPIKRSDATLLVAAANTAFHGEDVRGRDVQPEGPRAPRPPGVAALPAPGTMVVSPKLRELLAAPDGALLRARLDARVVGTIGDAGLKGPQELAFYRGASGLKVRGSGGVADRAARFGDGGRPEPLGPLLTLLVAIAVTVLLLPVAVFVAAAVRFGGEDRDRRLAALRLVGADRAMAARIAAGETLFGAGLGVLVGAGVFLAARPLATQVSLQEISVFPSDVRPSLGFGLLIVLGVPLMAIAGSLAALRRVVIEPLGVVRRAPDARRRLSWRVIPGVLGLLLLVPMIGGFSVSSGSSDTYRVAIGVCLGLIGITTVLPWLVEVAVRRLGGGSLAWQLATRRLQMDGGTAARVVSGIAVAVAGAIALQTLFTAAERQSTQDTGLDLGRAQVSVSVSSGAGVRRSVLARDLRATPGVRASYVTLTSYADRGSGPPNASAEVHVGDCAALGLYLRVKGCRDGDVFLPPADPGLSDRNRGPVAGDRLLLGETGSRGRTHWTVPAGTRRVATADARVANPISFNAVLATPRALPERLLRAPAEQALVKVDPRDRDAVERVRNTVARLDPSAAVETLSRTRTARSFANVRRVILAGATAVLLLIGASLLVGALEQLRERRQVLAVLVAFGTRRGTMAVSVLWQALIPVAIGLLVAVAVGASLGALLLKIVAQPIVFDWGAIAAMSGVGGAVVLLVTLLTMPALWRLMRPDGLRME